MSTDTVERPSPADPVAPSPTYRDRHPLVVQLGRYVVAGAVGTGVNALVFLLLRLGWDDALGANLVALVASTLVSTEVNRRFTFEGFDGPAWRRHAQTAGMVTFYAVYSSAVLLALSALVDNPSALLQTATVSAASVLGGAMRFLILRFWVFGHVQHPVGRWARALRIAAFALAGAALLLTSACGAAGLIV